MVSGYKKTELAEGTQLAIRLQMKMKKSMIGSVSSRKTLQCQINVHDTTSLQSLWRYPKWAFHATALARWKWFLFPYSDCWTNLVKSSNVMKVHVWQFERVWSFGLGHCEPWRLRFCRHVSVRSIILKGVFFGKSLLSTKSQRMAFDTAFIGFWFIMKRHVFGMASHGCWRSLAAGGAPGSPVVEVFRPASGSSKVESVET